jgi:hypothetical protein
VLDARRPTPSRARRGGAASTVPRDVARRGRDGAGGSPRSGSPSSPTAVGRGRLAPRVAGCSPTTGVADSARSPVTRAPRGHDAKPLMRSLLELGVDLRGLALDTMAIAAYLLDPAEARYELAELLARTPPRAPRATTRRPSGQLDLDGDVRPTPTPPRAAREALAVHHSSSPIARASTPRAAPTSTTRSRTRWCGCWPRWSTSASASTSTCCAPQRPLTAEAESLRGRASSEVAGRRVQRQLHQAAARGAVRRAGPHPRAEEDQDRLLHRRRRRSRS